MSILSLEHQIQRAWTPNHAFSSIYLDGIAPVRPGDLPFVFKGASLAHDAVVLEFKYGDAEPWTITIHKPSMSSVSFDNGFEIMGTISVHRPEGKTTCKKLELR